MPIKILLKTWIIIGIMICIVRKQCFVGVASVKNWKFIGSLCHGDSNFSLFGQRKVAKERPPRGGVAARNIHVSTRLKPSSLTAPTILLTFKEIFFDDYD